ncbi:hypothetical protein KSS87_003561, partial [Heliosperma pusillum]
MDSHQVFKYRVPGANSTYISSQYTPSSLPDKMFGPLKFNIRDSPISPFSTHFDCDTVTTLSDVKEHHSSIDSLSVKSPSCNSPLETNNCYHNRLDSSPSTDSPQGPAAGSTNGNFYSRTADYGVVSMKHALQELETELMCDEPNLSDPSMGESKPPQILSQRSRSWSSDPQVAPVVRLKVEVQSEKRHKAMEGDGLLHSNMPYWNLKELLIECARALSENRVDDFDNLVEKARKEVSISGDPTQRLGAYMIEGLVARKEASGSNIYHALRCKEPLGKDLMSYMHILYEICPYLKFGYMAANGAIAEACRNEDRIHIVDFQIAQGTQWLTLLQALAQRPGGAPYVRITGIDDPMSKYARGDSLEAVGKRLKALSEKCKIPIEFHAVPVFAADVTREMLDVRPGEALAVNFPLQLHHTPDESVDVNNPRDDLLRMVKSLNPKVTTLVEQESNTNTTPFVTRFIEALEYYSAMFESIDVTLPRDRKERINVEQHCLAKDIVNVIACEGKERVE